MALKKQHGISSLAIILIILAVIIAAIVVWLVINQGNENTNANTNVNATPTTNTASHTNSNADSSNNPAGWQTFTNNAYGYQLKFPNSWHYIEDAFTGPPPPVTAFFASVQDLNGASDYGSFTVMVSKLDGETLDTWEEIKSLMADNYTRTDVAVDGYDGIRLERDDLATDNGGWLYIDKDDYMYRFTWGATETALADRLEATFAGIISSITFNDIIQADFTQNGSLNQPATADSADTWHLLYEQPGSPGLSKKLSFDYQYIPSTCLINTKTINCSKAVAQGLLQVGDTVTVSGYEYEDGAIAVFNITK